MAKTQPKVVSPFALFLLVGGTIGVIALAAFGVSQAYAMLQDAGFLSAATATSTLQPSPAARAQAAPPPPTATEVAPTSRPTATPVPPPPKPTATPVPPTPRPTATLAPPTATAVPPTATPPPATVEAAVAPGSQTCITLAVTCSGSACPTPSELQTLVQWQDGTGEWRSIDGWQAPLGEDGHRTWRVDEEDLGRGPYRWVVLNQCNCIVLAISDPFDLPSQLGETVSCEVSLEM